jgi:7-keto-8-aminopelargonate synthetase-like enzyme
VGEPVSVIVVVGAAAVVVGAVVVGAAVVCSFVPLSSPDLINSTAIVTARRKAAGAPYRVSSRRLTGSMSGAYQPETDHTSRAYLDASAAAALRQSIPETRKA